MSSGTLGAAKIYQRLLKAVKKHIGHDGCRRHFRDFVTEEFRKNINLSDQTAIQSKLKLAHDYTFLLNSVHHHKVRMDTSKLSNLFISFFLSIEYSSLYGLH